MNVNTNINNSNNKQLSNYMRNQETSECSVDVGGACSSADKLHQLNVTARLKYLEEELAQAQADKEFVWSLWRQLQLTSPDLTNAISSVVQREKEKSEEKDAKVLKILQDKDAKIKELQSQLNDATESLRKQELKLVTREDELSFVSFNLKTAQEENQYLEQMVKQSKEEQAKWLLAQEGEKQTLCAKIKELIQANEQFKNREIQFRIESDENRSNLNILNNQVAF
jgi:centlein